MKLIMLSGLPASGKSTEAEKIVSGGGDFVRVTKDLLRTMLHYDKWTPRNEGVTQDMEKALVRALLKSGKNVVVDDTNLGKRHLDMWKAVAAECGATFEHRPIKTELEECIERDKHRGEKSVGEHTIVQMALQYGIIKGNKYVVSDLDGTLAKIDHRLKFVKTDPKDWKSFFAGIPGDTFREEVWEQVAMENKPVILISARPEEYREVTEKWLLDVRGLKQGQQYLTLIMRKTGDRRPDDEVKKDLYERYFAHNHIARIYDDRPRVIRMWREHGLDVVDVGSGIEF